MRNAIITIVLIFATCAAFGGSPPDEQPPAIGAKMNKDWLKSTERKLCMTHPAQLDPCFEHVFAGVKYTVAYSNDTKRVSYLYTSDKNFKTDGGLRVGNEITVSYDTVRALPGWEIHAPKTSDGWRPIIGFDSEVKLKDGSVLNFREKTDESATRRVVIVGFSKGRL